MSEIKQKGFLLSLEALISLTILLLAIGAVTHILGQKAYVSLVLQENANSIIMHSNNLETALAVCNEKFPSLTCSNAYSDTTLFKAKKYIITNFGLNSIELYISRN